MITEETFAKEEKKIGKHVHFHDEVWWVRTAPFYYKPVNQFRAFPPNSAKPHPLKALVGYSHMIHDALKSTRSVRMNILDGEHLERFSMDTLKSAKRRVVRNGLKDCQIRSYLPTDAVLEQMRVINISQAERFESGGESGTFLSPKYYEHHVTQWRKDILNLFSHKGHQFIGAFVGETLAAYIDLIQIEDTWMVGAVKSRNEYLKHRPVDALYFSILSMASQCGECKRVINGGGNLERESLTRFKGEFNIKPVLLPYYSKTILPIEELQTLKRRISVHQSIKNVSQEGE